MEKKKLINLIKKGEGPKLDFKVKLDLEVESGRKELAKDICAIANSKGGRGYLLIGVEDKTKKIMGIEKELYSEEQIQQIVSSRCEPPIPVFLEFIDHEGKTLGIITIYDGGQKPYQLRENGAFYIRRGSTTDTMRKQEIISALQENLSLNVELCPLVKSDIQFVDRSIVEKYFNTQGIAVNDENYNILMENASIIAMDKEVNKYVCTLGGALVFSRVNSIYAPHNLIRIINKVKKDSEEIILVKGDLISMIGSCRDALQSLLPKEYPIDAVVEAVKNGVIYRDYTVYYKEIEVILKNSSITVISPGTLLKGNDANSHSYLRRNMWIYEKVMALDSDKEFIKAGRGLNRIKKSFKGNGKVLFINSLHDNCFKIILPGLNNYK